MRRSTIAVFGFLLIAAGLPAAHTKTRAPDHPPSGPELFGVGVFSTELYELPPTFSPDGKLALWTVSTPVYGRMLVIMQSEYRNGQWTPAEVAPFSGRYADVDPMFSPDGRRLYFLSRRPRSEGDSPRQDLDIFSVTRTSSGWSAPTHLAYLSSDGAEHYVTASTNGTLYLSAARSDAGPGGGDIYRVPVERDGYGEVQNLGPAINRPDTHETTAAIAPDESFLIFGSRGRPDSMGQIDLYLSFRENGEWAPAINLGPKVNSARNDFCPVISPDGKWLYFSSERTFTDDHSGSFTTSEWLTALRRPGNGLGDTYRVALSDIIAAARAQMSK